MLAVCRTWKLALGGEEPWLDAYLTLENNCGLALPQGPFARMRRTEWLSRGIATDTTGRRTTAPGYDGAEWKDMLVERIRDLERTCITSDELCNGEWFFHFKEGAGPWWCDRDPYWISGEDLNASLRVVFTDNSCSDEKALRREVRVVSAHNPFEEDIGDAGIRLRFVTKSNRKAAQDRGCFIRDWPVGPTLQVSRSALDGAWVIENAWVFYTPVPSKETASFERRS